MDTEARRTGRTLVRILAVLAMLYGALNLGLARELALAPGGPLLPEDVVGGTLLVLVGLALISLSRRAGRND